jgi:hypothetical protein
MGKKNNRGETKSLSNLSRDILYSKDVPLEVEAMVENGVNIALLKLKKQNINWILTKLTGTSALQPRSEITYEVHFQGLTKFFKLIGDNESILMLWDRCPANCPSMKVESLVMYLWWKYYSVHVTLKDLAGKDVLNVTGKIIKCRGDWNDPDKKKGFSTAVWCIHKVIWITCVRLLLSK